MKHINNVTEFVPLGFTQDPAGEKVLFVMFLLIYLVTIVGNLLIVIVTASPALGSSMYFLLAYLSIMDAVYSATISFSGCMVQLFLEHCFAGAEVFLPMLMAYDHYVAICKPLHYFTIMKQKVCILLVVVSWTGGFSHSLAQILLVYNLPFCGPNVTDHFMCDMYPLLGLACTDTYFIGLGVVAHSGTICITAQSTVHLWLPHHSGFLLFVPCIFIYVRLVSTFPIDKSISVVFTAITPIMNPLTYTLRNSKIKNAMRKFWH
uniref:G-protein coupled receptors family 1 profile domain-containing protein n=1 Tax=Nannospalax galili TaxID=1026970 RepID=A0A8C6R852_NANGA